MKRTLLTVTVAIASGFANLHAQNVYIPDANFKAYLVGEAAINTNLDAEIQVSEAAAFTGLVNCQGLSVADLTGIEAFTSMTALYCDQNQLTTLDLTYNTALQVLEAHTNQLTSLNVSTCTALQDLSCGYNNLTGLDISSNLALSTLYCNDNQLTALDVSSHTALSNFNCAGNNLTSLDVSSNPILTQLYCQNNELVSLNVANGYNTNFAWLVALGNPNLTCIEVDDAGYSAANWVSGNFYFDAGVTFSEDCGSITGLNGAAAQNPVTVYPNPTNGLLQFSAYANAELTNVTGQVILVSKGINAMDLSDQPAGVYFLTLTDNSGQTILRSRVVKE